VKGVKKLTIACTGIEAGIKANRVGNNIRCGTGIMAIFKFLAHSVVVLANLSVAVTFFVTFLCGRQKSKEELGFDQTKIIS
jgi:hypothetical protein